MNVLNILKTSFYIILAYSKCDRICLLKTDDNNEALIRIDNKYYCKCNSFTVLYYTLFKERMTSDRMKTFPFNAGLRFLFIVLYRDLLIPCISGCHQNIKLLGVHLLRYGYLF